MKVNRMKTSQLTGTLTRLATIRLPEYIVGEDRKKTYTVFPKGDETGSQHARHIREELARRNA